MKVTLMKKICDTPSWTWTRWCWGSGSFYLWKFEIAFNWDDGNCNFVWKPSFENQIKDISIVVS